MFIIWRRHGWLILPAFLLTWWLADSVIAPIYQSIVGFEYLYNADKGICWAIAFLIVAGLIFGYWWLFLRREGKPLTDEEWEKKRANVEKMIDETKKKDAEAGRTTPSDLLQLQERALVRPEPTKTSTFFFIPMKWMPIIFSGIAIILLVVNIPVAMQEASGR